MFVGSARPFFFAALLGLGLATVSAPVRGEEPRLAISGYDPVAYFTDRKPVPGRAEFEYRFAGAICPIRLPCCPISRPPMIVRYW